MTNKSKKLLRWIILAVTIIATILVITLGGKYFVVDNARKSIEYGGGAEAVIQVNHLDGTPYNDKNFTLEVSRRIHEQIDPQQNKSVQIQIEGENRIRIAQAEIANDEEKQHFVDSIVTKPSLEIYDVNDVPLFLQQNDGTGLRFNVSHQQPTSFIAVGNPIAPNSARAKLQNNGWVTAVGLKPTASGTGNAWEQATDWVATYGGGRMVMWLGRSELLEKVHSNFFMEEQLRASNNNLYQAIHIDNDFAKPLRSWPFETSDYMVSDAGVSQKLTGNSFVIEGKNIDNAKAHALAVNINYGSAEYKLQEVYSHFVAADYGATAFTQAAIAGLVVFSLIAIFMMANYGLLGALSTISIALYIFLTLMMFTVMRGEYSPQTIAALIIGIGMSVDANIITFERLKTEVYSGSSVLKANIVSNKTSLSTIFDANITTLIVGFVLFFFGQGQVKGFSVMLILSVMFTLVIMLIFTRLLSTTLVRQGVFKNRPHLLGVRRRYFAKPAKIDQSVAKYNFMRNSKWFAIGSSIVVTLGIVVFAITAGIAGSFGGGFNRSLEFSGGSVMDIATTQDEKVTQNQVNELIDVIEKNGISSSDIESIYNGSTETGALLHIETTDAINSLAISQGISQLPFASKIESPQVSSISNDIAKELVKNTIIAIAIAFTAIVLYTLIRFRWTFSISAILALVHDGLIVTAVFVITRVQISPIFIAGLLSVIGYSINDTIVTFDRVREKLAAEPGGYKTKKQLMGVANQAIKDTFKRSILTSLTTLGAVVVLMSFGNVTTMSFNIAMLVGLISGTYSSIFIATYSWAYLETWRHNKQKRRKDSNFWKIKGLEEQTFDGINDYKH